MACGNAICGKFSNLGADDAGRRFRLGIMGGTFDPIHMGHLACAEQVADALGLDGVVFMPAGDPWMKRGRGVSAARDRLSLVRAAVADNPRFDVSTLEIDRAGQTYTVDTLRELRRHYPDNVELYFISGADAILSILQWRDVHQLGGLATFVAATRPGYCIDDALRRAVAQAAPDLDIRQVEITALAISSTELRAMVRAGRSVRYLVPDAVAQRIAELGLYGR